MSLDRIGIAILAGGRGSRLWPLSRPDRPKQFVPILPEGSMLQATFNRALRVVGPASVLVVGSREHARLYRDQLPDLPEENLILEPAGLGTAPCIGLTAALELSRGRFDVIVTVPADHVVPEPDNWVSAIVTAAHFARDDDRLGCIAASPDGPHLKFGYLQIGDRIGGTDRNPVYEGVRFVEKPAGSELAALLEAGNCLRNMGMLAFRPAILLDAMAKHVPDIKSALDEAAEDGFSEAAIERAYQLMPSESIDKAVLQEVDRLVVTGADIGSVDAGDFASLGRVLETDANGNAFSGRAIRVDASSNTIVTEHATVAVVGVSDLVVVVDGDTVLVCPKDQTQRIGEIEQ